jgi:hypothetical protein
MPQAGFANESSPRAKEPASAGDGWPFNFWHGGAGTR